MAIHSLQHPEPATQQTLLIAGADHGQRTFLAGQLDGDGHTIYEADHTAAVLAKLSCHPVDVLILGQLDHPASTYARPAIHAHSITITHGPRPGR